MGLFILVRKKGTKAWLGAIPVKKGVTRSQLRSKVSKGIKKGLEFRIVTGNQVKKLLKGMIAQRIKKKRIKKRVIRRRKKKR